MQGLLPRADSVLSSVEQGVSTASKVDAIRFVQSKRFSKAEAHGPSRASLRMSLNLPIGCIVVPFWGYLIGS